MLDAQLAPLTAKLDALQQDRGLTDRAVAAAIQLLIRTGDLPEEVADDAALAPLLTELTWLLFVAAPAQDPRYLLLSSMHLELVLTDDRDLAQLFDEIRQDQDQPHFEELPSPDWLADYQALGDDDFDDASRADQIGDRLARARQLLQDHHEGVREFSRQLLEAMATDFDRQVEQGTLSPLGPQAPEFSTPDEALEAAREQRDAGDLEAAVYLYGQVLKEMPQHLEALVERGILRAALEDLGGACEDFDRALTIDDDHLVARLNRGLARHSLGQVDDALKDYDRAIEAVDNDPEIFTNRGIARLSAGDLGGALQDLNRALELDAEFAVAYLQRGNVHRLHRDMGRALNDYSKAIKFAPEFVDAYSARAFAHLELEQPKKALTNYDRAIALQPRDPSLYYNRAHAHLLNDDVESALADYDDALALDPEALEALSNRGAARMMNGDLEGALQDWEEAIAIDPYYPTPYLKRASMWIATEQPDEAARDLQIALDNAPNDWPYREAVEQTLASILEELGFDEPT